MLRLLFWIAVIALVVWYWRRKKRATARTNETNVRPEEPAPMVRCATCGVHVPQQQALLQDQKWYCSHTHLPKTGSTGDH
ncbi:PP0621 family protein [Pseudomonas matsuisoli]|uniref:MYND finger n=1 Tax=Pseudomonas matsuisoli TaxID=1515666 RepID=A0A917UZN1_9PSED|nr:PP0621 family protein [Pseudomonas matsuisoli]GGK01688.1 hypothetical protein GCM10009304_29360 [Pseudomonas matsuisoli]